MQISGALPAFDDSNIQFDLVRLARRAGYRESPRMFQSRNLQVDVLTGLKLDAVTFDE